jgi:hypothetical protein
MSVRNTSLTATLFTVDATWTALGLKPGFRLLITDSGRITVTGGRESNR